MLDWITAATAGCCRCDQDKELRRLTGRGATDCGLVARGEDREPALACAEAAIAAGEAFYVGYEEADVREYVIRYFASDGATTWALGFYGGEEEACSFFGGSRCTAPPTRTTQPDGDILDCPHDSYNELALCGY